jgi:hypothetical protein
LAKYRLTKPHFINNELREAGTELETDEFPSLGMEALDEEAASACKQRDKQQQERRRRAQAAGMSQITLDNLVPKVEPEQPEESDITRQRRR